MDLEGLRHTNLEVVRLAYTRAGLPAEPTATAGHELENYRRAAISTLEEMAGMASKAQRDEPTRSALAARPGLVLIALDRLAMHAGLSLPDAIDTALSDRP